MAVLVMGKERWGKVCGSRCVVGLDDFLAGRTTGSRRISNPAPSATGKASRTIRKKLRLQKFNFGSLSFELVSAAHHFVRGLDGFTVNLIGTLGYDHIDHLFDHIDVRHF